MFVAHTPPRIDSCASIRHLGMSNNGARTMQLGMVGLGRMGGNIVRRLMRAGHACTVFDRDPTAGQALAAEGAIATTTLAALVSALAPPRAIWIMLPAGDATETAIAELATLLSPGDTIIVPE